MEGGELAVACRTVSVLQAAYQSVAPRVAFTIFSTWWNRWATARRFQQKACCRFCETAEDAIEHIAFCRVVEDVARTLFFLQKDEDRQMHWQNFLILRNGIGRNELMQRALFLQTIYSMYNLLRQGMTLQGRGAQGLQGGIPSEE